MKFTITMKDPDCVCDSIERAVDDLPIEGLDDDEIEDIKETRTEKIRELCDKWFTHGEYLTVEIDTLAKTCRVVPNK